MATLRKALSSVMNNADKFINMYAMLSQNKLMQDQEQRLQHASDVNIRLGLSAEQRAIEDAERTADLYQANKENIVAGTEASRSQTGYYTAAKTGQEIENKAALVELDIKNMQFRNDIKIDGMLNDTASYFGEYANNKELTPEGRKELGNWLNGQAEKIKILKGDLSSISEIGKKKLMTMDEVVTIANAGTALDTMETREDLAKILDDENTPFSQSMAIILRDPRAITSEAGKEALKTVADRLQEVQTTFNKDVDTERNRMNVFPPKKIYIGEQADDNGNKTGEMITTTLTEEDYAKAVEQWEMDMDEIRLRIARDRYRLLPGDELFETLVLPQMTPKSQREYLLRYKQDPLDAALKMYGR